MSELKEDVENINKEFEIKHYIQLLSSQDEPLRKNARQHLLDVKESALAFLLEALKDKENRIRWSNIIYLLWDIKDARAIPALIIELETIDECDDDDEECQEQGKRSIAEQGSLYEELSGALINIGKPAINPLIALLDHKERKLRHFAVNILSAIEYSFDDNQAVPALIPKLKDEDPVVRAATAYGFSSFQDTQTIEPLLEALKDIDPKVRQFAVYALAQFEDSRFFEPFITILKNKDEVSLVRATVARHLCDIEHPLTFESLLEALDDDDPAVRASADYALGDLGDERALPVLQKITETDNGEYIEDQFVFKVKDAAFAGVKSIQEKH
jgi:HEAT repeat protein